MAHLNDDPWQDPAAALEAAAGQLRMIEAGGLWGPEAPAGFDDVGIERDLLADLVLKMANMVPTSRPTGRSRGCACRGRSWPTA